MVPAVADRQRRGATDRPARSRFSTGWALSPSSGSRTCQAFGDRRRHRRRLHLPRRDRDADRDRLPAQPGRTRAEIQQRSHAADQGARDDRQRNRQRRGQCAGGQREGRRQAAGNRRHRVGRRDRLCAHAARIRAGERAWQPRQCRPADRAAQSGRALELMNQGLIWLADNLRVSYGEGALLAAGAHGVARLRRSIRLRVHGDATSRPGPRRAPHAEMAALVSADRGRPPAATRRRSARSPTPARSPARRR